MISFGFFFGSYSSINHRVVSVCRLRFLLLFTTYKIIVKILHHTNLSPVDTLLHLPTLSARCRAGSACIFSAFSPLVQPNISSFEDHEKRFVNRSYLDRRPGREWFDATCRGLRDPAT